MFMGQLIRSYHILLSYHERLTAVQGASGTTVINSSLLRMGEPARLGDMRLIFERAMIKRVSVSPFDNH
jgi:hypothetical protein